MNLKNESYTIFIGTNNFTEKYYRNKIYNVLDFYPYIMNIYFTNKYKSLEKKLIIQDYKYKCLEKKIKYIILYVFIISIIIMINFSYLKL